MDAKRALLGLSVLLISSSLWAADKAGSDSALTTARRFVDQSDRYLHHSHLQRGMTGYGLTVMAGTKLERFEVEIVSVITKWGPHQDAILAKLSGLGLEKTGIIAGMSGSPVFVRDPSDGRDKIIGAVAFGWTLQKEPLCGIQPITQMLAIQGVLPGDGNAGEARRPQPGPMNAGRMRAAPQEFLDAVLNPAKVGFASFVASRRSGPRATEPASASQPRLAPLSTPLMVSGFQPRALETLATNLRPFGLVPLQGGGIGAAEQDAVKEAKLEPGSALGIPLVAGDAEISAVGTVTDIVGDHVLAFGHDFYGYGDLELPMGPAYVHTVVASMMRSFKVSSMISRTGTLSRDERVGIAGTLGSVAPMIPMTVTIDWKGDKRQEQYRYQVCRHRWFTPMVVSSLVGDSASGWRDLPEYHTVRYSVDIDFGELGKYHSENTSSGSGVLWATSDAVRPLVALLNSPLDDPPEVQSVDVRVSIEPVLSRSDIQELRLDGVVYRPGDTVTGYVTVRPFRQWRQKLPIRFQLPDLLPDGAYSLTASDAMAALAARKKEAPHRFTARTNEEMFAAIRRVVEPQASRLYLRLPLREGGVAIGPQALGDLPESRAKILLEARQIDTKPFSRTLERSIETEYVLEGSASASLTVRAKGSEIPVR
jgi:hypothetical protein